MLWQTHKSHVEKLESRLIGNENLLYDVHQRLKGFFLVDGLWLHVRGTLPAMYHCQDSFRYDEGQGGNHWYRGDAGYPPGNQKKSLTVWHFSSWDMGGPGTLFWMRCKGLRICWRHNPHLETCDVRCQPPFILLIVQKSQGQPPFGCIKLCK